VTARRLAFHARHATLRLQRTWPCARRRSAPPSSAAPRHRHPPAEITPATDADLPIERQRHVLPACPQSEHCG
jgi:hypothetical protein